MFAYPLRAAALTIAAAVGLSACSYGYGPYGGSSVSVGIGSGGYYDPYYGYGYGYGAGYPYWGWYDGFYYPGTGYYIYDRYRRPYRWSDRHRRYWEARRERSLAEGFRRVATDNWEDFSSTSATSSVRRSQLERTVDSPTEVRRFERSGDGPGRVERSHARSERGAVRAQRSERAQSRSDSRSDRSSRSSGRNREDNRER